MVLYLYAQYEILYFRILFVFYLSTLTLTFTTNFLVLEKNQEISLVSRQTYKAFFMRILYRSFKNEYQ